MLDSTLLSPETIPDIRTMASLPTLTPPRRPTRMGSLSPNSIPSSPTSVHSSSSAIFERDIEPLAPTGSLFAPVQNPHRIPRGKQSETIDAAVPTVLSAAASVLVASPAPSAPASPSALQAPELDPLLVIAPTAQISSPAPSGRASREQSPRRRTSTAASERMSLFAGTGSSPPSGASILPTVDTAPSVGPASNRLSFVSYTDLLLSAPISAVPLSALTSPASADPPPHLPAVSSGVGSGVHSPARSRPRSVISGLGPRQSVLLGDDVAGEWEREGLGRGLEERLEELLKLESQSQVSAA